MDYTISQFRVFCKSALRAKSIEQAMMISTVALGAQGTEKAIKESTKKLLK